MLFSRLIRKEFARTALMALAILLSILLTVSLVKLLGLAAGGSLSGGAVLAMLAFGALTYLPVLLSASIFTALLMSLTRLYRDSEMVVWQSCGLSLLRFAQPILRFAIPMAFVVALLSLVISPWAIGQKAQYQKDLDVQDDTSQITPGVFRESHQSDQVFFVDALSQRKEKVANVFVQSVQGRSVGVIAADSGHMVTRPNGDRYVVLERGRRYEGEPGTLNYRLVDFEKAQLRIDQRGVSATALSVKSMSVIDLLRHPTLEGWGELHWRIGLPLSLLVLSLCLAAFLPEYQGGTLYQHDFCFTGLYGVLQYHEHCPSLGGSGQVIPFGRDLACPSAVFGSCLDLVVESSPRLVLALVAWATSGCSCCCSSAAGLKVGVSIAQVSRFGLK
jgi:Predicted permeases